MPEKGYIYVLMNPSMEGIVKIGKTNRDPQQRAKELSATTGVPTPFVVVYDEYFEDCTLAENFVHAYLEHQGYRVSENREFFKVPLKYAISAVISAKTKICTYDENNTMESESVTGAFDSSNNVWIELFEQAEDARLGLNDKFRDIDAAINLYKKSIKLGGILPYLCLGKLYRDEEECKDFSLSIKYLSEGAERGLIECYAELSDTFCYKNDIDNAVKCWDKFFNGSYTTIEHDTLITYGLNYVRQNTYFNLPLNHLDILTPYLDDIKNEILEIFNRFENNQDVIKFFKKVEINLNSICLNQAGRG